MFHSHEINVAVRKADGGFVLEWDRPIGRVLENQSQGPGALETKTHGLEVFTDSAALLKRLKELL